MKDEIKHFVLVPRCSKCGGTSIRKIYRWYKVDPDYILCNCRTCGWGWYMHPKDYEEGG